MAEELTVRGGSGGTVAHLDEMLAVAKVLEGCGDDVQQLARAVTALTVSPDLLITAPLSPVTFALVQRPLLASVIAPDGFYATAVRVELTALLLRACVELYRTTDEAAARCLDAVRQSLAQAVGRTVVAFALPVGAAVTATATGAVAADLAYRSGQQADLLLAELVTEARQGCLVLSNLDERIAAASARAVAATASDVASTGQLVGVTALDVLAAHPGAVEHMVAVSPGLLTGLLSPVTAGPVPAAGLGGGTGAAWSSLTGAPWPPRDVAGAVSLLAGLGAISPVLRDGDVVVRPARSAPPAPATPPRGVADLVSRVAAQSPARGADGSRPEPGQVRLERITGGGGTVSWVVVIPGTQSWHPIPADGTPMDLTTNVHALAGAETAAMRTVIEAMRDVGVGEDEPVLLAGNSQGGMTAAGLAADAGFRAEFEVTHVVTIGSPVATADVPDGVQVLSLEHEQDLVPSLDGAPNPDRPSWVTVTADVRDHPVAGPLLDTDPLISHDTLVYLRTGAQVDSSTDPSVVAWTAGAKLFLARPGAGVEVFDRVGRRVP